MRRKMKRSLMVLLALATIISLLSVSAMAVAAQSEGTEEVPDYDIWTAQTMLFGYENAGNGLYPTFRNFQEPVYKQLGGYMLDNKPLTALSTTWTVALNEDFRKNPDFIYEAIIISYLKYGNDEAELESELQSNARNFAVGLYGALEEHYEGKWEKLLDSSSKEEAEKMIGSLSGMSEAVSAVSEMVSTGKELISAVSDYLGLQKVKDDRVLLLEKARAACAAMDNPNQNFIDAADKAIRYMNTNIVGYMAEETAEYMYGKYLDSFWEAATVAYPALKGIKLSRQAIELCFNTTSGAESNLKLALLYTADYYFQLGLMSASKAFMDDQTSVKAAQTFMGCFRGYIEFQMYGNSYAKDWVDEFKDQQGILAAAIQQMFYRENLDEAARLSDLCESQTKNRVKLLSIIGKYRRIYEKKYCNAEWMGYLDNTDETVSVTGVQFDAATRTVELDSGGCYAGDATVLPTNATNRTVTYTSSDPEIFSVSSSGFLNPLKEGTATLTATSEDGGYTAEQTIQVVASKRRNVVDSGTCGSNLMWALYKDGMLYISGSGRMPDWNYSDHAPWYSNRSKIKKVKIEKGVANIGEFAFYECSLTDVIIPDSVKSIERFAFNKCRSLTGVTVPDSVTCIENFVFDGCSSLTSITIPDGVTSIGSFAFRDCRSLTGITIPSGVTSIDGYAFENCTSLKSVYISDVEAWCKIQFEENYYANPLYYAENLYVNDTLVTDVVIPDGVTKISDCLFSCNSLASITIPDSVTSIGGRAFYGCSDLDHVIIPGNVTSIGDSAFYGCSSLSSIAIPDSVTSVGNSAFQGCSSLKSATIGNCVTSIGDNAFDGCSSLSSVVVPDSVTSVGNSVFQGCSSLKSAVIGDNVPSIGDSAFQDCSSLTSITIGKSVTKIGCSVFDGCDNLKDVHTTDINAWCRISFSSYPLKYADNLYLNETLVTDVVVPDGVTNIGNYAFSCTSLKSITIPSSVTSIGSYAFYKCSSLNRVTAGNGIADIGDYAFYECSNLSSVVMPENAAGIGERTEIGERAFSGCQQFERHYDSGWCDGN